MLAVDNSGAGAVYKGLAIANTDDGPRLYAANFHNGTVNVLDSNFKQVDSFTDPNVPKGYAPFNVQVLDGHLFVTFALQDAEKHDDVSGPAMASSTSSVWKGNCCIEWRPGTAEFSMGARDCAFRLRRVLT